MAAAPWPEDPLPALAGRASMRPAVILDDDPTGTQTLRDVSVLTIWDADAIARHLGDPVVFLSTNSRALSEVAAVAITHDAAVTAWGAAHAANRTISIVSRSDSTLRGHFPAETAAIAEAIGAADARVLLAPYFGEGGRVTVDDVHLLLVDGERRPVGSTEYARDASFGYRSSDLRDWVAEKYAAVRRPPPPIISLSLDLVRTGGPDAVAAALAGLAPGGVAIANAEVDRDIEVVALGGMLAEAAGLSLVARTAASYVRARAGRAPAPLLGAHDLPTSPSGLLVVGSHVDRTSRQLEALLASPMAGRIVRHELAITPILASGPVRHEAIREAAMAIERVLSAGRIGLLVTERTRHDVGLDGSRAISSALVEVVEQLEHPPEWVIAKGGITSSDIASRAMRMHAARVAGQIVPGVPVWISTTDGRWPGVPLVVFPGNVGDIDALARVVNQLVGK